MRSTASLILTFTISAALSTLFAQPMAPETNALARTTALEAEPQVEDVAGAGWLRRLPVITPDSLTYEKSISGDTQFLVLRLRTNASAARLYIRNMALPAGAKLFLYGRDETGVLTNVEGPYDAVGPLQSGQFWSGTIIGSEIVVELQVIEPLPDLPFEIVGLASANPRDAALPNTERVISEYRTSIFRGMELTHAVENGIAIFEGDIVLGPADELPRAVAGPRKPSQRAIAITGASYRWPNGIIPYRIDPTIPKPERITNAIAHWNNTLAGRIQWVPKTNETAAVFFVRSSTASNCSSSVGRRGYEQGISIGDSCATGNVIHEMGHAVGLWHEQSREDRDKYVKILWENMQSTMTHNFTQNITNGDDVGVYDYGSIMHYPATGFSANGKPTIETIPPGIPIGQRTALSATDIAAVKALYPIAGSTPEPPVVNIDSIPTGLNIQVDGVTYKTPAKLEWTPGSVHTLSAINPPVVSGTRNDFVRWTDGGPQTHTVIAPTASVTYRADYATSYSAIVTASSPGTAVVSPVSSNAFYPKGSSVEIEAVPPPGSCFTTWTGLAAGTPAKTTLSMQKAYTTNANYAPGSMSVSPAALTVPITASTQQIAVNATSGCVWTASSPVTWIKVTSGTKGTGNGIVTISTTARTATSAQRSAVLTIAGQSVVITQ